MQYLNLSYGRYPSLSRGFAACQALLYFKLVQAQRTSTSPFPDTSSDTPPSFPNMGGIIAAVVILSIVGFGVPFLIAYYFIKKVKVSHGGIHLNAGLNSQQPQQVVNMVHHVPEVEAGTMERFLHDIGKEKPIRFTAQELNSFTKNYKTRLGSGGFGIVYQGQLPNGLNIAVKVLKRSSDKRVEAQFMAEVGTIGRTYHINLVRLYGFCFDHWMSALVYEYMENGSLDKFLFTTETPRKIEWKKLQEIAIGTAKGLAYLHEECQRRIIHYDIKPGNVLLDVNFSPKVADFGLAKLCNRDNTHVSVTGYRGTPGYSAPEFLMHNYPITHKCDVYSFGMLLFEIARGKRNSDLNPADSLDWFPKKAWEEFEKGRMKDLALEFGIEEKDGEEATRMVMVALWCVQDSPDSRPPMSTVVKMLEGGVEIMPPSRPFQYLYALDAGSATNSGSNSSTTRTDSSWYKDAANSGSNSSTTRTDSSWYKDATPIMRKYEIQIASST